MFRRENFPQQKRIFLNRFMISYHIVREILAIVDCYHRQTETLLLVYCAVPDLSREAGKLRLVCALMRNDCRLNTGLGQEKNRNRSCTTGMKTRTHTGLPGAVKVSSVSQ